MGTGWCSGLKGLGGFDDEGEVVDGDGERIVGPAGHGVVRAVEAVERRAAPVREAGESDSSWHERTRVMEKFFDPTLWKKS